MNSCHSKFDRYVWWTALALSAVLLLNACGSGKAPSFQSGDSDESIGVPVAAQDLGERLFLDTRFSQYFAIHMTGVNDPLTAGDPVMDQVQTTTGTLPGPFVGQSMNCRSCHFVDELNGTAVNTRAYADYTPRSPISDKSPAT